MDNDLLGIFQALDNTSVDRESYVRCPIPYPGSKARSLDKLLPHLPYSDTWIDVCGGSGAVTLARRKSKFEVFNDRHAGIVSFYRCLRDVSLKDKLVELLDLTIHSREDFIWSIETWEHDEHNDVERAARWYYTVIYSFATVGRNFGRAITSKASISGKIRDKLPLFQSVHERFRNIQVENQDWRLILKDYDSEETVFYIDPPYYGKKVFKHEFTKADHIELCQRVFNCKGFVALSGYDNPIYDSFPWDRVEKWKSHVSITSKAITTDTSNVTEIGINSNVEKLWIKENY